MLLRHSNHTVSGHFSILTGQQAKDTKYHLHMQAPSLLTDISAALPSANRNEESSIIGALCILVSEGARIGNALRTRSTTEGIPNTQYLNAWPTAELCQKGHGRSNTSSYLFLNFTRLPYLNSLIHSSFSFSGRFPRFL